MGIFGQSSPFDAEVEKATSETNTNDNWSFILDVCDEVTTNPRRAKDCLKSIMKRMAHPDPHVVMQAITLLDACANNCGKPFHLEIASRDFETEFRRLLGKAQPKVSLKMRQVLKNWAENDFKNDPELNLIPSLYAKLRSEGFDFSNLNEKPTKGVTKASLPKDPNVVSSQQEEDDIAKAIELSLKETKNSPKHQTSSANTSGSSGSSGGTNPGTSPYPSLYPSFGNTSAAAASNSVAGGAAAGATNQPEPRKVRALYDFEAAEENELTFFSGEIIHVLDDSDPNWWKGYNQRGEGLFPSNFVTADLSVDPERLDINQQHKSATSSTAKDDALALQQQQKTEAAAAAAANQPIEIDEAKIDRLLHLLHEANPEDPSEDTEEMLRLEQEVHQMGPLIDAELERVDRKHAQLTQLSSDLVDAVNLYHSLMRDDRAAQFSPAGGFMPGLGGLGYPPTGQVFGFPGSNNYGNGPTSLPPQQQSFSGLHTLPYASGAHMPLGAGMPGVVPGGYGPQIPMQFQNGHATQLNSLPAHLNATLSQQQPQQQQQQPIYAAPNTVGAQQQQQQHPPQPNYQMLPPDQQQQTQQPPPPPPAQTQYPTAVVDSAAPASAVTAALPQFMSPQHQQQQQQPAPPQAHIPYMPIQPQTVSNQSQIYGATAMPNGQQATYMANMQQQPPQNQPNLNNHHQHHQQQQHIQSNNQPSIEQFSQLQQQMAAMSIGLQQAMPPPLQQQPNAGIPTQSYIMQNDAVVKSNIPIYQQQR